VTGTGHGHQPRSSVLARAVADAASRGWFVFPVHPDSKIPAVKQWEARATRDPEQIARWWSTRPYNIGIACGPSGLVVVDIDVPRTPPQHAGLLDGSETLVRLAAAAGGRWPPETTVVQTPSGGTHWYFRAPDGVQLRNTQGAAGPRGLGWCVDTRGHGGYVTAAGSTNAGRRYRTINRHPVAALPDWLVTALTPPQAKTSPSGPRPDIPWSPVASRRVDAYVRAVVEGETSKVAGARVGERHRTLLAAARRLGRWVGGGAISEAIARQALSTAAAHYIGVQGYTAAQVERDITDGLAYGTRAPRGPQDIPRSARPTFAAQRACDLGHSTT
jgi:hypothetical protein